MAAAKVLVAVMHLHLLEGFYCCLCCLLLGELNIVDPNSLLLSLLKTNLTQYSQKQLLLAPLSMLAGS